MKKVNSQKWSTMRFEGLAQKDEGIEENDELDHKMTKSKVHGHPPPHTVWQWHKAITHAIPALGISFHF